MKIFLNSLKSYQIYKYYPTYKSCIIHKNFLKFIKTRIFQIHKKFVKLTKNSYKASQMHKNLESESEFDCLLLKSQRIK